MIFRPNTRFSLLAPGVPLLRAFFLALLRGISLPIGSARPMCFEWHPQKDR
jgi:hypothetical protein